MIWDAPRDDPLVLSLREPAFLATLDKAGWLSLVGRARRFALLPRLADLALDHGTAEALPAKARIKLRAARTVAEANAADVRYEIHCVARALDRLQVPIVLLKGGAYLSSGLSLARRRFCGDLDIMVPKAHLAEVEATLLKAGWQHAELSDYDDRYYRQWMHELPPMVHPDRGLALDLHHTIHPPTARHKPNTEALFAAAIPLGGANLTTLCPADMVLHAGLHLFNEEIILGLSDLADVHDLLTEFGRDAAFWDELRARARIHGLGRVLYYLLRYARILLDTPIPERALQASAQAAPRPPLQLLMDWLFVNALVPPSLERWQPLRAVAVWLLYVRSHWLRMPLRLLIPHLSRKALRRQAKVATPV